MLVTLKGILIHKTKTLRWFMKSHTVEVRLRGSSPMSECHEKADQTEILDLDENLEILQ